VAIAGAGPAGLAAAYYLRQEGYACTVFDDHEKPGGMLRYAVPEDKLPRDVLDGEIALIEKLGIRFQPETRINDSISLEDLRSDFDAVLLAFGRMNPEECAAWPLAVGRQGIKVDRGTRETSLPGVFAAGDVVHPKKLCVAAVAAGKGAATSIHQFLSGGPVTGPTPAYTTHIGSLQKGEIDAFMAGISPEDRTTPAGGELSGFLKEEARHEALRCLHCDCRKPDTCRLRIHASEYGARPNRFNADRRTFEQERNHPDLIYEPGKCISCGICVRIAASASGNPGLAFEGRGFDVRVAVPFGRPLSEGLGGAGIECAAACPTGALALKADRETSPD
jgi:ferredoxin